MKKGNLIIYWLATALLCFGMLGSGVSQVMHVKDMVALLTPLGYPVYFMTIIGVWKILAVIAILMPGFKLIKEWAYAGLFFVMTGALLSHLAVGDVGFKALVGPVMQIVFIILSWYFRPASRKIILTDQ
ncbi:hypothetical protein ABIB62_003413 [Mucilaginibacter sp. UYP25]|uniref:DoxX family protein n=1 Tax=unclassified Mucilaginibacter TaxID=2617802 RepID=UPI0033926785